MKYTIRIAVPGDERKIRELFIEMLQTIYHTKDVQGYETGCLDRYWTGGEERIYIAEEEEVVAYLSVEVHHEPEGDYIYLDDLSVTEKYRSHGIGSALIRKAETYAREIGIPAILFHVEKSNTAAFRLYERLGYGIYRDDGSRYLMHKSQRVLLRKMTEEEFQSFKEYSISDYAEDLMKGGNVPREQAYTDAEEEFLSMLPGGLDTEDQFCMSIEDSGSEEKVGWIWFLFEENDTHEKQVFLADLLIFERERRKGYASSALHEMEDLARSAGCRMSVLYVWEHDLPAYSLYQKCGYGNAGQTESGVYLKKRLEDDL